MYRVTEQIGIAGVSASIVLVTTRFLILLIVNVEKYTIHELMKVSFSRAYCTDM